MQHYLMLHYRVTVLNYITLHCNATLHYITSRCITLCYGTVLHHTTLHPATLHYRALHSGTSVLVCVCRMCESQCVCFCEEGPEWRCCVSYWRRHRDVLGEWRHAGTTLDTLTHEERNCGQVHTHTHTQSNWSMSLFVFPTWAGFSVNYWTHPGGLIISEIPEDSFPKSSTRHEI